MNEMNRTIATHGGGIGRPHEQRAASSAPRGGSALIVVLWVIGLLAMMISTLAFDAHIEARITSYYRKRLKAEYLARSGIEIAELLLAKRATIKANTEAEEDDRWFDTAKRLKKGAVRGLVEKLGDGTITLDIVPEPSRRNINKLAPGGQGKGAGNEIEDNLARILEVGGVTEDLDMWPELVDSFMDWTDNEKPAQTRTDGAETEDYYDTLEPPYQAKNGPLDTVGELLLVKGFDRAIVYGGVIETGFDGEEPLRIPGIIDLLTTYGDGKVNVNAASQRVLMTLPETDDILAGAIVEAREAPTDGMSGGAGEGEEDYSFENMNDLFGRIPDLDPAVRKYVTFSSSIFRITSTGTVGGVTRKVWCIAQYAGGGMKFLRWREEDL